MSAPRVRGHLPALDGLRGIAILLVLILHATEGLNRVNPVPGTLLDVTRVGFTGVDLFFVLSGFLISGILLDAKHQPGYYRIFYARRVLRIFPLYYAYLAIVFFVLPAVPQLLHPAYPELQSHQAWYWLYGSNVLNALRAGWGIDGSLTPHFWSLAVEEQFYLIWPTVVLLCSSRGLRNLCLGIIVVTPLLRLGMRLADVNPVAVYVLTVSRADALAMGGLIAVMLRRGGDADLIRKYAMPGLVLSIMALAVLGLWRHGFDQFDAVIGTAGYSAWAAGYGALLAVSVVAAPATAWISSGVSVSWLRFLGKYSYAIYVFHMPVTGLAERVVPYAALRAAVGNVAAGATFVGGVLVVTTLLALLSWWAMEHRFIALKDRFRYAGAPAAQ